MDNAELERRLAAVTAERNGLRGELRECKSRELQTAMLLAGSQAALRDLLIEHRATVESRARDEAKRACQSMYGLLRESEGELVTARQSRARLVAAVRQWRWYAGELRSLIKWNAAVAEGAWEEKDHARRSAAAWKRAARWWREVAQPTSYWFHRDSQRERAALSAERRGEDVGQP